jgi:dihydrolipoamide dehydrogenase
MSQQQKTPHLVVIGGGPGGYVAAIRAAQLGARVTLVEKARLGGTCLNVGCIPTKALLHAASLAGCAAEAAECGVRLTLEGVDWERVLRRKDAVVTRLVGGLQGLMRANRIEVLSGEASFVLPGRLSIQKGPGERIEIEADRVIIATGSSAAIPPIEGLGQSPHLLDSTAALSLEKIPETLLVLGAGAVGVELATVFRAFGSRVVLVEALPRIVPSMDGEISAFLLGQLKKQGIEVYTQSRVASVDNAGDHAVVRVQTGDGEKIFKVEKLLVAAGRRAQTDGLALEKAGIESHRGRIVVDEYLQTSAPGVYAVGDCLGQVMLAHTASAQGETAAENALGGRRVSQSGSCPSCVYTFPELAGVGLTEEQAREQGIAYHTGRFPMAANGRALIRNQGEGFVKIIAGDELNEILGVHIAGPDAAELIMQAAVAMGLEATTAEIISTIHAHPTVSECLREAALASENRAIHAVNRKMR